VSGAPGSARRDTASPPVEPAAGAAAKRGAAGVESERPGAPGVPEVEASATRCTEPAPLLAPALGEFGGLPVPTPEREACVEPGAPEGDTAVFGVAEAGTDGGVPGLDGAGAPGVADVDVDVDVDEPVAGAKPGRTGSPGVAPRGPITSGVPLDSEAARRALSASTIEAMPCRTSLFAPSDGAPADEGLPGMAGDALRLTVPSAAAAAGGAASTRAAGALEDGLPAGVAFASPPATPAGRPSDGAPGASATEASATRCTDGGVAALGGPAGVPPPVVEAPALVVALDDVVAGVAGAADAAFEAADDAADIGARNPKAGGASGAVRASPGRASRIRGVSEAVARGPASAALAIGVSATRATSPSTARWIPGVDAPGIEALTLAAPEASAALPPALGTSDAPRSALPRPLSAGPDAGSLGVATFEVGCVADGAGGTPRDGRDAGASFVKRSAASTDRATGPPPALPGLDGPPPAAPPVEKRGARSTAGDAGASGVGADDRGAGDGVEAGEPAALAGADPALGAGEALADAGAAGVVADDGDDGEDADDEGNEDGVPSDARPPTANG